MDLACSSESYAADLDADRITLVEWLRLCAVDLGLRGVELEDRHLGPPTPARLAEVRTAADRLGLEIVNVAFMNDFGMADDRRRDEEVRRTIAWMDATRTLGARFLRTFAGWPEGDRAARWPGMVAALRAVAAEASRRGVRLVLENHDHGGFVRTAADVEAILAAVDNPVLGVLLDTGNYLDGLASIERTAHRAWHVHTKFTQVAVDGRDTRVDYDAVLPLLRAAGYRGWLSVEYEGPEPAAAAVPRALAYLRRALAA